MGVACLIPTVGRCIDPHESDGMGTEAGLWGLIDWLFSDACPAEVLVLPAPGSWA